MDRETVEKLLKKNGIMGQERRPLLVLCKKDGQFYRLSFGDRAILSKTHKECYTSYINLERVEPSYGYVNKTILETRRLFAQTLSEKICVLAEDRDYFDFHDSDADPFKVCSDILCDKTYYLAEGLRGIVRDAYEEGADEETNALKERAEELLGLLEVFRKSIPAKKALQLFDAWKEISADADEGTYAYVLEEHPKEFIENFVFDVISALGVILGDDEDSDECPDFIPVGYSDFE